ncbi:retrovirus-related pol polyprotein from transposon TNT 1-94 [Tanacetum coccineum]|uniref:Retrovirus-related pol polyprotein from transposon TNT 1-94 n=1 Tax=Tanacetum coccineum TaxID=301880 RepID=A0ABQ5HRZ6_9ASTR
MLSETPKLLSGIEDSHHGPSDAMHNPPSQSSVNFSEWSKQVTFHLGALDIDLALLEDKLADVTDASIEFQKSHHKAWTRGGQLNSAPVLEVENFTNWKKRFMCHIIGIEPQFENIIKNGPFIPMVAGQRKPEGQWTADERKAANLDQRLKSLIMSVLPDDQMNSVINCLTAKSTWDDLILYHEGPSDVKESRVMDLKLCYNTFKFKEGESLTQTFTRYKALMNELVNDGINLSKLEINTGFINGLPKKWLSFCQSLRNTNHVKDSELASLFGKLKYEENLIDSIYETEKNKSLVSATPLSTTFFSTSIVQDFQDSPDDEEDTRSKLRPTKDFEAKYNKVKAKLALLSSNSSSSKALSVKNKGLIAEAYEWDEEEEVSPNDNEMVEVKVLIALAEDNDAVSKEGTRNGECVKISMRKYDIRKPIWYLDSGCSRHMTVVKSYLHKYFDEKRGTIFNSNKEVVMIVPRVRDVYVLDMTSSTQESCFFSKASENLNWLWQKRLDYLNFNTINKLAKQNLVIGLPLLVYSKDKPCSSCEKEKHHRANFKTKQTSSIKKCSSYSHGFIWTWFKKRVKALQAKKAEALKSTKAESSNTNRSKTPTKSRSDLVSSGVGVFGYTAVRYLDVCGAWGLRAGDLGPSTITLGHWAHENVLLCRFSTLLTPKKVSTGTTTSWPLSFWIDGHARMWGGKTPNGNPTSYDMTNGKVVNEDSVIEGFYDWITLMYLMQEGPDDIPIPQRDCSWRRGAPTQYKEYLCEFWYTAKTLDDSKIWVSTPKGGIRGDIVGAIGAKGSLKKSFLPPWGRLLIAQLFQCLGGEKRAVGLDQIIKTWMPSSMYCIAKGEEVDYVG